MVACLLIALTLLIRFPFLEVPPDRDVGALSLMGNLWRHGALPYRDLFEQKPPFVYVFYSAACAVFGPWPWSVSLTGALAAAASAVLLSVVGGWPSGLLFALWSAGPSVEGWAPNAELFMNLMSCAAAWAFLRQRDVLAGMLGGLAAATKQPGAAVLPAMLIARPNGWRGFLGGAAAVWAGWIAYFSLHHALPQFWDGVAGYTFRFFLSDPSVHGWANLLRAAPAVLGEQWPLWALAMGGALATGSRFLVAWLVLSMVGVALGGRFYHHYFLMLIPPLALLGGAALTACRENLSPLAYRGILAAVLLSNPLVTGAKFFFRYTPDEISRATFGTGVYPAAQIVADHLRRTGGAREAVHVWGADPEIYFLSNRRPAMRYLYEYHHADLDGGTADSRLAGVLSKSPSAIVTVHRGDGPTVLPGALLKRYRRDLVVPFEPDWRFHVYVRRPA